MKQKLYSWMRAKQQEKEVLSGMTEGMLAFATKYKISLDDPELKELYDYEMSARSELASAIEQAKSEGREEVQVKSIRSLYANGAPIDLIYKSFDLPRQEIDAILNGAS